MLSILQGPRGRGGQDWGVGRALPRLGPHTGSAVVTLQGQLSLRSDSARPRSVAAAAEAAAP